MDSDGNYGYKKAGADTVIPFRGKPLIFTSFPADVKSALPNVYVKLTLDDFIIACPHVGTQVKALKASTFIDNNWYFNSGASYNAQTGKLNVVTSYMEQHDQYIEKTMWRSGIFALWKGTINGK